MKATFRQISKQISKELATADKSLSIAVSWFTNETLFDLILDKIRNGVSVELIVNNDNINNRQDGLDFNLFIKLGGKFYFAESSRLMHHKFAIIDNSKLISGSYNWTYNAEYSNNENIVFIENASTIEQFSNEFNCLKLAGILQSGIIDNKPKKISDLNVRDYLKEDYYFKSVAEEKNGNMNNALRAIETAQQIDQSDLRITERIEEIKNKVEKPKYYYHIEDGQFSFDFTENRLLGKVGQVVKHYTDRSDDMEDEFYILFIDGFYVECIGNIERSFPANNQEHDELKEQMLRLYGQF